MKRQLTKSVHSTRSKKRARYDWATLPRPRGVHIGGGVIRVSPDDRNAYVTQEVVPRVLTGCRYLFRVGADVGVMSDLQNLVFMACTIEAEREMCVALYKSVAEEVLRLPQPSVDLHSDGVLALGFKVARQSTKDAIRSLLLCNVRGFGVGIRLAPNLLKYLIHGFIWPALVNRERAEFDARLRCVCHAFIYLERYWLRNLLMVRGPTRVECHIESVGPTSFLIDDPSTESLAARAVSHAEEMRRQARQI
jgi:hypothetical protein